MKCLNVVLATALLVQVLSAPCLAEEGKVFKQQNGLKGKKVRITAPSQFGKPIIGKLDKASSDTLVITRGYWPEPVAIPVVNIKKVEVSHAMRNSRIGFIVGLPVGSILGATLGKAAGDDPPGFGSFSAGDKAILLGIALGLVGGIVGGLIGALHHDWQEVSFDRLHFSSSPQHHGGLALSASFTF